MPRLRSPLRARGRCDSGPCSAAPEPARFPLRCTTLRLFEFVFFQFSRHSTLCMLENSLSAFQKRSLYQTILFNSRSGQTCRSHPRVPFLTHSISSLRNVSRLCFLPHPLLPPQIRPPSFLLTDVPTAILVPYSSVVCTAASTVLLIAWQFMSCLCSAPPLVCHRTQNSQHPHILP